MHDVENGRGPLLAIGQRVAFSGLTVGLGVVGQTTFYTPAQISLIWPLSGVALLWLLASRDGRALIVDCVLLAASAALSLVIGIGGYDRAAVGAVLAVVPTLVMLAVLARWGRWGSGFPLRRMLVSLSDLLPLGVAIVAGGVVSAVLRAWGMGLLEPSGTGNAVLTAVRTVAWTFVPVSLALVCLAHPPRRSPGAPARTTVPRVVEAALVLGAAALALFLVFTDPDPLPVLYPSFLVVVWAALRTPPPVATAVSSGVGLAAICFTLAGDGPFVAVGDPRTGAVLAQGFLVCLTLVSLIMSLSLQDRREAQGRAEQLAAVAQGRTDLLDAVIANIAEGILVVQDDDTVVLRNAASVRLGSRPSSTDAAPYALWQADGVPVAPDQLPSRIVLRDEDYLARDFTTRHDDAVEHVVEVNAVKLPASGDLGPRAVVTFRDVTQERSERSELEAFAGVVAHDLANPLTIIQGWSEALVQEAGSPGQLDHTVVAAMSERIMAASTHMHTFINDLLSYTTTRNQPLRLHDVDLTRLCLDVVSMRVPDLSAVTIDVQPGMAASGDSSLLRQLMDNLIGNSLKYVAPGTTPHVSVTAETTRQHLCVTVTDNGIGIPAEDRAHVFGDFYRVASSRHAYQGTGLGLAICHRVVTRHGGDIRVLEPVEGSAPGTSVQFTLPHASTVEG